MGASVPVSLLAAMMEISTVWSVMASATCSAASQPFSSTGRKVTSQPACCMASQTSSTARCSVLHVMMCLPLSWYIWQAPLIARLLDSVAHEVQTISRGLAPISLATCSRAASTAASAFQPNAWLWLDGLPKSSQNHGSMASRARLSTGVVAL